ncbi:osmotically inducible protein C [Salinigranum rubrum]|uniref:Osmotically inducible protein C n=1 Tax=Salinigranum rubrum TaxID=755307 RepID=A0A2I8VFK3_9EURY|nr:OsmC family protein [Salinigranum rubrum]AUV80713.1 osmotically inducible protein C [Salinigranum rubrum]
MVGTPAVKTYEVAADCTGPKAATVTVRDLAVEIDAPESSGGANHGPTPVEFLLGSLAGCFNVTGSYVAREMDLDLTIRAVSASGDLDTTTYLTGEGTRAGYGRIRVSVEVETTATAKELEAWRRETERRNPVLDTIARPTPVGVDVDVRVDD